MSGRQGQAFSGGTGVKPPTSHPGRGHRGYQRGLHSGRHGCSYQVLDIDLYALAAVKRQLSGVDTLHSDQLTIDEELTGPTFVIGAVPHPGSGGRRSSCRSRWSPHAARSVIGSTSASTKVGVWHVRVTTHGNPTFVEHGCIHYCVDNMAGVVPITSTLALTNATSPLILPWRQGGGGRCAPGFLLARGINVWKGKSPSGRMAEATGNAYFPLEYLLPIEYM